MGGWDRRVLEPAELPDRAPAAAVEPGPVTAVRYPTGRELGDGFILVVDRNGSIIAG